MKSVKERAITSGAGHKPSSSGSRGPFSSLENVKSTRNGAASVPRPKPRKIHTMRLRSSGDVDTPADFGLVGCQKTKIVEIVDLTSSPETPKDYSLGNRGVTGAHSSVNIPDINALATGISQLSMSRKEEIEDVDANDDEDFYCAVYINDIVAYMLVLEKKYPIMPKCLNGSVINSKQRAVLMDWLVQVHITWNMYPETLFLCQKILDRFLIVDKTITREKLELVGVTSLFLAAKYEEPGSITPRLHIFVDACDKDDIKGEHIRAMEMKILATINYDLGCPPAIFFLRRFSRVAKTQYMIGDFEVHTLSKYIMELSIIDYEVIDMMPSAVAAGSLALAMMIWEGKSLRAAWTTTLEHYSTYSVKDVRLHTLRMAHVLARVQEKPNRLMCKAVTDKYAKVGDPFHGISRIEELHVDNWKSRIVSELKPLEEN